MKLQIIKHRKHFSITMKVLMTSIALLSIFAFTQITNNNVSGKLTGASDGEPLIGASVQVVGTSTGTFTGYDGTWSLSLPEGKHRIEFSYMGYTTQTKEVFVQNGKNVVVDVALQLDATFVNEVTVVGYAIQKKEDVTGSIVRESQDEIAYAPVLSVDKALQGKAAGVQVRSNSGTPGGSMDIVIRGRGTTGDANPLYVVDGVPIGTKYMGEYKNIKSVSVKKDVNSCAMYGARGANGVVIITTVDGNYVVVPEEVPNITPEPEPEVPSNTENYNPIVENPMQEAIVSPMSTFSIDVDKAAYANVRRFLNNNQKPDPGAIRLEEMINYFDYSYPQPTDGTPFSIHVEAQQCPWNAESQLVLVGLQGKEIAAQEVPPCNLVFLIDVSGSMSSANKLGLLKQSFGELVGKLRPEDKVSIVVYAGAAGLVLPATSGAHKEVIFSAINNLSAGGSTAGGAGIELAYKIAKENFIFGGNNRVILATDGDFNVGASSDAEMVKLIESKRDEGVFLSILGFGMGNYKDSKMESLSNAGNGNYSYIDNIQEAKKVFGYDLWGTLYTIAKDVKIQIEFNPAVVKSYRLIGYENRMLATEDFANDKKDAGEIGSNHSVTALYEIVYVNNPVLTNETKYVQQTFTNTNELMTVNVRYKEPEGTKSKLITKSVKKETLTAGDNIQFASCVAQFGLLLRNSEFKGNSTYSQVLQTANNVELADEKGYRKEFIGLVQKAQSLY